MKKFILLVILGITSISVFSQKTHLADLKVDAYIRGNGVIAESEVIQGYYTFYSIDKPSKGMLNYGVQITDENGTAINSFNFTDTKQLHLLESSYQNGEICFRFLDAKEKGIRFKIFNTKGELINNYFFDLDKSEYNKFLRWTMIEDEEINVNTNLFDIGSRGFLSIVNCEVNKKNSFKILKFTTNSKSVETFAYNSTSKFSEPDFLGLKDDLAFFRIEKRNKHASSTTINILALDINTWKVVFETNGETLGEQIFVPSSVVEDPFYKSFKFVGSYFKNDDNLNKDESQGLAFWEINREGILLKERYKEWSKDFKGFLNFKENNKSKDIGYVKLHKTLTLSNGKIVAIGEGYRKVADGVGIAMAVLSQGQSGNVTKLQINDLVVFKFDEDFNFLEGERHKKNYNSFSLEGIEFASVHRIANILSSYGYFDYSFTQVNEDRTEFIVGYNDIAKGTNGKRSYQFFSLRYLEGQENPIKDAVQHTKDATSINFYPNQFGKIAVAEYFRKLKKFDFRIVKLK